MGNLKCSSCGKEIRDGYVRCPFCGVPTIGNAEPRTKAQESKKPTRLLIYIIPAGIVLIAAIVLLIVFLGPSATNNQPITLEKPTELRPGSGEMLSNPTPILSWKASAGATSYRVQISSTIDFTNLLMNEKTAGETFLQVPTGFLKRGGTYHWRVHAGCPTGQSDDSSTYFSIAP